MIDQMEEEIGQQHNARPELKTAQNGLHPKPQFTDARDMPSTLLVPDCGERCVAHGAQSSGLAAY
ncbi:hypothetical protein PTKU64_38710 [Paraburkholderia terrae]|uniref:Uncharacterized protein n=1 Tax=Paraburkholderia terrae TaxID=311230 RepID=A0ABN6JIN9_9BURK|nr:hypothetical protein PTKU64_38710 [Paraburkholderia terrae]